jgi:acyl dehydratase
MAVVDDLQKKVGTEIGVGDWFEITQARVNQFADATEDHQWIHVDAERAAAGPFGGTIAHGFLTLSLIVALAPAIEVADAKMGINYGLDRVRFISPVPVGSRIRARTTLQAAEEVKGGLQVKNQITVEIEGQERPACVAESLVRYVV